MLSKEHKSLIWFVLIAIALTLVALWLGNWFAASGPTRSVAKPGQIVFISDQMGSYDVWMMNEDGSEAKRLAAHPGDERETVFAPGGDWIYFTSEFGTKELQLGRMRPSGRASGKFMATGESQSSLSVSSGWKKIGYVSNSQVFVSDLDGRNPERILPSHADESLDMNQLRVTEGDPPPLRRYSLAYLSPVQGWVAAISQGYDDQRAYLATDEEQPTATLLDPDGRAVVAQEVSMAWSHDGKLLAMAATGPPGKTYIAIYDPTTINASGPMPFLTPSQSLLSAAADTIGLRGVAWSADGSFLVFERIKYLPDGSRIPDGIWKLNIESGKTVLMVKGDVTRPLFSPDGKYMLYQSGTDLMRLSLADNKTLNLTKGKGLNRYASWSPVTARAE